MSDVGTDCPDPECGAFVRTKASRSRGRRRSTYARHLLEVHPSLGVRDKSLMADAMLASERPVAGC